MGEIASGIAHEINQPLSAVTTYAQVAKNIIETKNPDLINLSEILTKIQQQILKTGKIINGMKNFGDYHRQRLSHVDINDSIYNAANICNSSLKFNNIKLNLKLLKLPAIFIDHIQIEQVLINLIKNSIDALQDLPLGQLRQISIHSHLIANNEIQVSVNDNGIGINEDQKLRMLMPFYTTKKNGSGMGLSISRSIIEAHEGSLKFNSKTEKGTTFYLTLPIQNKFEALE